MRHLAMLGLAALLAACSGGGSEQQASSTGSGDSTTASTAASDPMAAKLASARTALAQCIACHKLEKGAPHGLGPTLWSVYGTKAGELEGYNFSPAMKGSGFVWDDAGLDKYLADPRGAIPGNKMSYSGQKDPAKRKEMIEALKSLKE